MTKNVIEKKRYRNDQAYYRKNIGVLKDVDNIRCLDNDFFLFRNHCE